jgi:hypothetical protein
MREIILTPFFAQAFFCESLKYLVLAKLSEPITSFGRIYLSVFFRRAQKQSARKAPSIYTQPAAFFSGLTHTRTRITLPLCAPRLPPADISRLGCFSERKLSLVIRVERRVQEREREERSNAIRRRPGCQSHVFANSLERIF